MLEWRALTALQAIILGTVEGLTEFLPVSSTGHLILAARVLAIESSGFLASFTIAIQLGAILAVVVLYWRRLFVDRAVQKRVIVAFLPTAMIGFVLYRLIKLFLLDNVSVVLWSLLLGGLVLIIFERYYREEQVRAREFHEISYRQSFYIGLAQAVAVVPGVSRAAATIVGGLVVGLDRKTVVEFSFLLAVPTMVAATGYDLLKNAQAFSGQQLEILLLGGLVAFGIALLAVKVFLRYVGQHSFTAFGLYRVALALLLLSFW